MSDLELFSMPLCPFAHRVRLALAEKGGKNATVIAELIRYNWPRTLSSAPRQS
jgi:hypothetical protein